MVVICELAKTNSDVTLIMQNKEEMENQKLEIKNFSLIIIFNVFKHIFPLDYSKKMELVPTEPKLYGSLCYNISPLFQTHLILLQIVRKANCC